MCTHSKNEIANRNPNATPTNDTLFNGTTNAGADADNSAGNSAVDGDDVSQQDKEVNYYNISFIGV